MKKENLKIYRLHEKIDRLKREIKETEKEYNHMMLYTLCFFEKCDDKKELESRFTELYKEIYNEKCNAKEQVFLLSLKICIINDAEKERIVRITRKLLGDDILINVSDVTLSEYKDYLHYILNKKMDVSVDEIAEIVHIHPYSIKRNVEYRTRVGFRHFSK